MTAARFLSSGTPGKAIMVPGAKAAGFFSQASRFSIGPIAVMGFEPGV